MLRLRQSTIIHSQQAPPGAFALAVWVGTIGGAALTADPSPNVTPPAAGRILICGPKRKGAYVIGQNVVRVICGVVAASTATFQLWLYDDTLATWVPYSATFTIAPTGATTNSNFGTSIGNRMSQKVFVQMTANTLVQAFGYDLV